MMLSIVAGASFDELGKYIAYAKTKAKSTFVPKYDREKTISRGAIAKRLSPLSSRFSMRKWDLC